MKKLTKTADWLSVKDLHGIYVGVLQDIYSILEKNISKYPDMISYRLVPGCKKRQVLCLKKDFISEFAKISGLELRSQSENWITTRDIRLYVFGDYKKIYNLLKIYAQKYPERIKYKKTSSKRRALYLDKVYLQDFISVSKLVEYKDRHVLKTNEWLSVADLEQVVVGNYKKIGYLLKEKQRVMPYAIQYKKSGSNMVLCLNEKYIQEFINSAGLISRTNGVENKTTEWLNAIELKEFVIAEKSKLRQKLRDLQCIMPYAIQIKFHKAQFCICLHKNYIDEFLQKSGFKRAETEITSQKTIAWLSATEIQKYVTATQSQIQELLVKYTKLRGREFIAYKKAEGKKQPILCLNKKYLKNFVNTYDLKWKKDVLRAGMIKLQTINPNKQFDTIVINTKKQISH